MKPIIVTLSLIVMLCLPNLGNTAKSVHAHAIEENSVELENTFQNWADALENGSTEDVVGLYHEHAILLATLEFRAFVFSRATHAVFFAAEGKTQFSCGD